METMRPSMETVAAAGHYPLENFNTLGGPSQLLESNRLLKDDPLETMVNQHEERGGPLSELCAGQIISGS